MADLYCPTRNTRIDGKFYEARKPYSIDVKKEIFRIQLRAGLWRKYETIKEGVEVKGGVNEKPIIPPPSPPIGQGGKSDKQKKNFFKKVK